MNQTTKRKAPSGRAVLTRTTRKDKHRKYRPISEMTNALKLNQQFFEGLKYRDPESQAPQKLWGFEELQTFI
jgi:hypothetical protein